ncbi:MarR family winged helix-turn-helix transcriptional regulator [Hominifimenecus sp. rT4P-3]|uniref:MarR family winged helix-turn-helix transcriptional regulator n=1 Tax=Hominifimenecus sp. rT4P-3 TaxID=3242979 RepID=UPI003DA59EE9
MADPVLSSLLRINKQRMKQMKRALAPYGYVGVMHLIVLHVRRNPGVSQEEIACFFSLDKTSVARDARRLEEMGHICRKTTPEDRRQYQLYLTEAGQAFLPVLDQVHDAFAKKMSEGIAAEDWETLRRLLQRVEENCFLD